ncbi:hypothetical protein QEH52_05785 [Coraliomargarita sp. SDUM461003]|uniref:ParE-like toxin domain-containing protein n=1 Tax=Thalassobacterium maritimum TaxID=3041265 RepID=A0ABU1AS77_9BACT|nr:hypothetical protein [Coraliomargarita sp. SDUM461003]MDQ8207008.1 hypothetical protein [Coraliomargarita sp. SDUM461003]
MRNKVGVCLSQAEDERCKRITQAVEHERQHPAEFGGKPIQRLNGVYSIPPSRRKRMLVKRRQVGFVITRVVTHEKYNQIIKKRG